MLLILPDTALEDAVALAEKLRRKIGALSTMHLGQQLGRITASFGVAEYPSHGNGHAETFATESAGVEEVNDGEA